MPIEMLLERLGASMKGFSDLEAQARLEQFGLNEPARKKKRGIVFELLLKFANPLVLVLLVIAGSSLFFGEKISAALVSLMAVMSVLLSFIQEHKAGQEAEKLSEMVRATATVFRNGRAREIKMREIVPGDVVDLYAGDMIPADLRILSCKDLFINQASLTGESIPVEKIAGSLDTAGQSVTDLRNIAFMGSSVVSGTALGLVTQTGVSTQFGEVSRRLATMRVETGFDRGLKTFVWLMLRAMLLLVAVIFIINMVSKHKMLDAFLFSLAVAVGLTPEMLPMLVALNLSKGAMAMAKKKVIVKRLNAIQNLGAMDILCTDKTGTLTMDNVVLEKHCDVVQREDHSVHTLAFLNSHYQTGLKNLLDRAIIKFQKIALKPYKKVDEIPFDFSRRIMSVVVEMEGKHKLIAKGAPEEIFKRCARFELDGETLPIEDVLLADLKEECDNLSSEGFRVLAIAYKDMETPKAVYSKDDESDLVLKGYLAFLDPPKPSTKKALAVLRRLGIECKVLTGDNQLVTKKICGDVGLDIKGLLTGDQVEKMSDDVLRPLVETTTVFARLSPLQKERVIRLLHENGHIVGYLGDGINDAPSLKASDVGISVDNAVDIAKESADLILLKKSLAVLEDGVLEGRRTFANIVKYIKIGASSNFGNMFSMTGASLLLPFLPMLPIQILLNNFLYDISQVAIPSDEVDKSYLLKPRPWDVGYIKKVMYVFGPISSLFDFITFGAMLLLYPGRQDLFHTGWFLESIFTQTLVVHVIRTDKIPFLESRPSRFMVLMSAGILALAAVLPYSPLAGAFGFVRPPASFFFCLFAILAAYLLVIQFAKNRFIKKHGFQ